MTLYKLLGAAACFAAIASLFICLFGSAYDSQLQKVAASSFISRKQALTWIDVPRNPVPAGELPLKKLRLPPGFKIEVYASGLKDPRSLRQGDKGTVFVSTRFGAGGKIYAITESGTTRRVDIILDNLPAPNGIEYFQGSLYVATPNAILAFPKIEENLKGPPSPKVVYDKFPDSSGLQGAKRVQGFNHGWRYIAVGPDKKLYFSVGALCNICEPKSGDAEIRRINLDGTQEEVVARGVRNSVGFDWRPQSGELYFTENSIDLFSEDFPQDELDRITVLGSHFGFPYCHENNIADPEFGWGIDCSKYEHPIALLGPHTVPLGIRFYQGTMFPRRYHNALFIARRGGWSRTAKNGADIIVMFLKNDGTLAAWEEFMTGFIEKNSFLGRPVDLLVLRDGALLVSDNHNHCIYRITYDPYQIDQVKNH